MNINPIQKRGLRRLITSKLSMLPSLCSSKQVRAPRPSPEADNSCYIPSTPLQPRSQPNNSKG
ncbi:hypothetical protein Hanom_Chr00s000814g01664521 [Helianthus anomalus]